MSLLNPFRAGAMALRSLVGGPQPPRDSSSIDVMAGILGPGRSYVTRRTRDQAEQLRYYKDSPAFRKVSRRIGEGTASARWRLYAFRGAKERSFAREFSRATEKSVRAEILRDAGSEGSMVEVYDHPLLSTIREGSPLLLGHLQDMITEVCMIAAGEAFWVLQPNGAGVPYRSWMIPPHWVTDIPNSARPWFDVQIPAGGSFQLPAEWVVWFRDPDPHDPYARGVGAGATLASDIEADNNAAEQVRLFFHQGMKPEILLMGPGLTDNKQEKLRQDWQGRLRGLYKRWMFHMVDAPKDAQVHQLSQDFDGEGLTKLRQWEADTIRTTLGVNPEIVGEIVGSNRATSVMARTNWRENVLQPRLEHRRVVYQHVILPMYQSPRPLVVEWDLPAVADQEMEKEYATIAPYAASWAQHAARQGVQAPDGADDVYFVPINMRPMHRQDLLNPKPASPLWGTPSNSPNAAKPGAPGAPGEPPAEEGPPPAADQAAADAKDLPAIARMVADRKKKLLTSA